MNVLLALIIFTGLSIAGTQEISAPQTVADVVTANGPAAKAGMLPGDHILSVAGTPVTSADQLRTLTSQNAGKPTAFEIERGESRQTLTITPNVNPANNAYLDIQLNYFIAPATADEVTAGSIAEKAGLKPGDVITAVNGTPVTHKAAARLAISSATAPIKLTVQRNGTTQEITIPSGSSADVLNGINFKIPYRTVYYSPGQALGKALGDTWDVITSIPKGIQQALAGQD